jgi:hypothetical protein
MVAAEPGEVAGAIMRGSTSSSKLRMQVHDIPQKIANRWSAGGYGFVFFRRYATYSLQHFLFVCAFLAATWSL